MTGHPDEWNQRAEQEVKDFAFPKVPVELRQLFIAVSNIVTNELREPGHRADLIEVTLQNRIRHVFEAADIVQPWPRAQPMPTAIAGGRVQPWHLQAVAEYDKAHGMTTKPDSNIPGCYAAAQVNRAIAWWNRRTEGLT